MPGTGQTPRDTERHTVDQLVDYPVKLPAGRAYLNPDTGADLTVNYINPGLRYMPQPRGTVCATGFSYWPMAAPTLVDSAFPFSSCTNSRYAHFWTSK